MEDSASEWALNSPKTGQPAALRRMVTAPLGSYRKLSPAEQTKGSTLAGTIFNLANTVIGAGILALPYSMQLAGVVPGLCVLIAVASVADLSIWMLLCAVDFTQQRDFGDVGKVLFGRWLGVLVDLSLFLVNVGLCTSYIEIIGDLVPPFIGHFTTGLLQEKWFVLAIIGSCVLLPLSSLPNLDALRYTSLLCLAFMLFFVALVTVSGSSLLGHLHCATEDVKLFRLKPLNWLNAMPYYCFAFVCHMNVPILYYELRRHAPSSPAIADATAAAAAAAAEEAAAMGGTVPPAEEAAPTTKRRLCPALCHYSSKRNKMMMATHIAIGCVLLGYCIEGVTGYNAFREMTDADILKDYTVPPTPSPGVSFLICTVTFYANLAHSLTRSP
jgi:amino acid permease